MSKVWFITGTSSGFGRAIAEEALARGERVVATARKPEVLADLAARAPDRVLTLPLDVTRSEDITRAVAAAEARFGGIDVLVNNAGYSILGAVEETSMSEVRAAMEPLFFGAVALTAAVVPAMRTRRSGVIVQISSVGGLSCGAGFSAYCAAKHALEGFSESLQLEVAPFGMKVLIVEPGAFRTNLFGGGFRALPATAAYEETVGKTREYARAMEGNQPGDPVKAAKAIVDAVHAGVPTLRLPLGADAVDLLRAKVAQVTSDIGRTEAVARATQVD